MITMEGRLLNLGTVNSNGVMFAKDCKISHPKKVPVTWNFRRNPDSVIGNAEIFDDQSGLSCKVNLTNESLTDDEYFVGGYYEKVVKYQEGDILVADSCALKYMSIVLAPADKDLKIRKCKKD